MSTRRPTADRIELLQGTLDLLILQTLQRGPLHGYAITQHLRLRSRDVLQVDTGALYPALHRLEYKGWIKAEWASSENNRRAKFYSLTRAGNRQLKAELSNWTRLTTAIASVLEQV